MSRFDDPSRGYGVMYLGESELACFVETFGQATGQREVAWSTVAARCMSTIALRRPLRLVDLTGPHLAQLGADAGLFAGPRGPARAWSRAFFDHPDRPDGLRYPSRHDNHEVAIAIFERPKVRTALKEVARRDLGDPSNSVDLGRWLDHYGFALL